MTVPNVKPTVSIITVCYNSGKTIESTILSVIAQDYPSIEYIIVDGASGDNTLAITKKYSSNISKQVSEPDKGLYDAMNKGIAMATGDIIGILNSDDIFASDTIITEIVNVFANDQAIDAVYGNITYFKDEQSGKVLRSWITKSYYPGFFDNGDVPPHPSLFVKKNVYDAIGTYFPGFRMASDYEFMLRAFKVHQYQSYHLNKFVVSMRVGGETTKSVKNVLIANREVRMAWEMNNLKPPLKFWLLRIAKKIAQFIKR